MSVRLKSGPMTMYAQLSMILRSKIMLGEWPEGFEIPTLGELCGQYDVARVTARQAVQILVQEGMLSSQRGRRTFVSYIRPAGDAQPLFTSIGSAMSNRPDYSIIVLEIAEVAVLPDTMNIGTPRGRYVYIRKIDHESGEPYAYSENYVRKEIFDRFPVDAVTNFKLARLIRKYSETPLALGRERLRVAAADYEDAERLQYMMSAPVARIERIFCDDDDIIAYFGTLTYRGDRFAVEHDITSYVVSSPDN